MSNLATSSIIVGYTEVFNNNIGKCCEKFYNGELELDKDIKQWNLNKNERVYSLDTCCFVTRKENDLFREHRKSNAISFIAINNGSEETFESIAEFTKKYNLNNSSVSYAIRNGTYHKGWKFERI